MLLRSTLGLLVLTLVSNACPFAGRINSGGEVPRGHPEVAAFREALAAIDFTAVEADIKTLLTASQANWPADYGVLIRTINFCRA